MLQRFLKKQNIVYEAYKKVKKDIKDANKYIEKKKQINAEKCEITEVVNKKMKEDFRLLQNLLIGKNYKNSEKIVFLIRRILAITSRIKYIYFESDNSINTNNSLNYEEFEDINIDQDNNYYNKEDVLTKEDLFNISKIKCNQNIINNYLDIKDILSSLLKQLDKF